MTQTRRGAIGAALFGAPILGVLGAATAGEAQAAGCASAHPAWAKGHDGQRRADMGNGTFLNPIVPGNASDPDVLKDGDDYWLVFSSFAECPGLQMHHSRDLVNWVPVGPALTKPLGLVFAPGMAKHAGRYFIYFPAAPGAHGFDIYAVWADHPTGPWSEPVLVAPQAGIDPGHVVGEDGKRYLFLSGGNRVRLTDDGLKADGPVEKVYAGWRYPEDWIDEGFSLEGPKLFRRGDWFYLVCAEGGSYGPPTSHMITVARSRSINGPWENALNNPLVRTASADDHWWTRGHGGVVEGPGGDWWVLYHAYENGYRTLGRQALLEPLAWTADGWPRSAVKDIAGPITKPKGGSNVGSGQSLSDDFSAPRPSVWRFTYCKDDDLARVSLAGGALTLAAKGSSLPDSPAWSCIPVDQAYEVQVQVESEGGAEGGVMLYIGPSLYVGLGHNGKILRTYNKGAPSRGAGSPIATGVLWLKIVNDRQVVTFYTSADGQAWTRSPIRFEVSGYNVNVAQSGESLRIGLYSFGSGAARFRRFTYRALSA